MTVHIIGAGLAGLSAALRAADRGCEVIVHEAAGHAGGRCHSWFDPDLGAVIDNGTHMVVGANRSVFRFLDRIGARGEMRACRAALPMTDPGTGASWTADPLSLLPTVIASVPRLLCPPDDASIAACLGRSRHFGDFWEPLAVSIMNTPAGTASARLFRAVLSRTLWRGGGSSCQPHLARNGLTAAFVAPAQAALTAAGATLFLHHPLRRLTWSGESVVELAFDDGVLALSRDDRVVLAVPWSAAARLIGGLPSLPSSPIVNAHFRLDGPPGRDLPEGILGLVGAEAHWLFVKGNILSVTVSAASRLADLPGEEIASRLWADCARALSLGQMPLAARVVKERRATLFHNAATERLRPVPRRGANLALAGDWTATGLPCTLEGAILSGERAVDALDLHRQRPGET